jgi:small-conductance mechanosensitive channel/CRP-like cAMP-binding protein
LAIFSIVSDPLLRYNPKAFFLSLLVFLLLGVLAYFLLGLLRRSPILTELRAPSTFFVFSLLLMLFFRQSSLIIGSRLALALRVLILISSTYLGVKILKMVVIDFFLAHWKGVKPPAILGNLFSFLLYLLSLLFILHYVLEVNLTPILATSAVVTVVVGLALQDLLGNLFSGLALQFEKSFEVGDWVSVQDQIGKVAEMNWRSIKLHTREDDFVVIPNGSIAKEVIINYSQPEVRHARVLRIGFPYQLPPTKVREVIQETVRDTKGILAHPPAQSRPFQYKDFSIEYEVRFWIDDFSQFGRIEGEFLALLWYRLDRAGIFVPFPTQHLYLHPYSEKVRAEDKSKITGRIVESLRGIEILSPLSSAELERVASQVRVERFSAGEIVLRQGDPGDSFFVIKEGKVEVSLGDCRGDRRLLTELGKGNIFGEMSLLTGEARSANIIALSDCEFLVLDKQGFGEILTANPTVAHALSEILAKRKLEQDQERAKGKQEKKTIEESSRNILEKIKAFFGLT